MPKTLITAALPYANGPIHIGHLAGVYLPADIYARYLRNIGKDVLFICGSDEHGVPITLRAKKENRTPQEVVDEFHGIIAKSLAQIGISLDHYSRTSNEIHHQTAQEFFTHLYNKNVFTEITTEQYFDEHANQFLADRYIVGTCPVCSNENAYGDQCEKCGSTLSPTELKNPRSALSGNVPIMKPTKNWYLPLDSIQQEFLTSWLGSKSDWKINVQGQCRSWLNDGLKPRAMTRDLDWGVPVPLPNAEGKVLYVWFEAPIGYISATKEAKPNNWKEYWTNDAEIIHFIGKDNIVFHCIIFPAMLQQHGDFALPKNVPANEFLNLEGNKISTSKNWAVWVNEYLQDFPDKQDELRYVLTSIIPETKDSEFTWADFKERINSELVAIFGNFVNRIMVLNQKFYNGKMPLYFAGTSTEKSELNAKEEWQGTKEKMLQHLTAFKFRDALFELMNLARIGNKFLAETEPWKLIKSDEQACSSAMNFGLQLLKNLCFACEPFLPYTHEKMSMQFNYIISSFEKNNFWNTNELIPNFNDNHVLGKPEILFQKIEDELVENQINKLKNMDVNNAATAETAATENISETKGNSIISYDDFAKIELKIATIIEAKKVEKADKLLQIEINVGTENKTVVSGIAMHYAPEEIIGKQVLWLSNLAPRKLRGIESNGMLLLAEDNSGKLVFVSPENKIDNGSIVK